jgi:glycosyltransferase involved in cell wall biosynthesis
MNILLLSWRDIKHPHSGGAEINNFEQAKVWISKGHTVTVFSSMFPNAKSTEVIDGINVIRKGSQVLGVHYNFLLWYLLSNHAKFDLVIDQFHGIPFFIPLFVRVKKVAYIHEVAKEVWLMNPWRWPFNIIVGFIGKHIEPIVFLLYKKVPFMTVSNSTKEDLILLGIPRKNIMVILNGVTLTLPKQPIKKEKIPTLMYLGAVAEDKGIRDAIKTFAIVHQMDPQTKLWIVGKGESHIVQNLKDLCKELNILAVVEFKGFVSKEEKFKLLSKSHLLINPSVREGWGLVNIESAACGTPVVAYDVPGVRDSVLHNKTGILVKKVEESEGLAKAVQSLLNNKTYYNKLSKQSEKWGKSFSWERMGEKSEEYLRKIAQ